ncbi:MULTISPECIES: hypothetical protein [Sorangium]|uniref:hypothetical protein n=1 Tax=Sorangium TaxID=39643 RepID=UPI003D9C1208
MRTIGKALEQVRESAIRAQAEARSNEEVKNKRREELATILQEPFDAIKSELESIGLKPFVGGGAYIDSVGPGLDLAIGIKFTHPRFDKNRATIAVSSTLDNRRVIVHFSHGFIQGKPEKLVYDVVGSVASDDLSSVEGLVAEALCLIASS